LLCVHVDLCSVLCCMSVRTARVTMPLVAPRRWFMLFARWHIYSASSVCLLMGAEDGPLAEMHIPSAHVYVLHCDAHFYLATHSLVPISGAHVRPVSQCIVIAHSTLATPMFIDRGCFGAWCQRGMQHADVASLTTPGPY
jgi:hypothetical protein